MGFDFERTQSQVVSHGLFEAKLSEIVFRIWEIRRKIGNTYGLLKYMDAVRSLYLVLPKKIKMEVKPKIENLKFVSQPQEKHPLERSRKEFLTALKNADEVLEAIINSLDEHGLLVLYKPKRLKGKFDEV